MTQTTLYASVLAKIGAERSKLLNETKIKALAESRNLTELITQLRDTGYQEQIAKLPLSLTSRKLERAFAENLIDTYIKIIKYSPKRARNYLSLYLLKFEIENIKALIKATSAKLSPDEKLSKIYFSVEDFLERRLFFDEAAKASTIIQIIQSFKDTEYWAVLNMGLKGHEESGSIACFDIFLDKYFYEKLYDSYESLVKKEQHYANFYASIENDSFTLLTLLRGKALNFEPDQLRLLIPQKNFNLSEPMIEALLSAMDFEAALKIVFESYYAKFFVEGQNPEEIIATARKTFNKTVFQYAKASRIGKIFNIGLPLAFMVQREVEVHNLVAVALGVDSAMKVEDIRSQFLP